MKYLFSTFQNMALPQYLGIFFVKDKKKKIKSSYQIQRLIQHRSKTSAHPLSCVLSGYLAWFCWPMCKESCVPILLPGPGHILHKDSKVLHIALRESMLFPHQVQRRCEVVMFWAPRPEAGNVLLAGHRCPWEHPSDSCVASVTLHMEQDSCKQAHLLLYSQFS